MKHVNQITAYHLNDTLLKKQIWFTGRFRFLWLNIFPIPLAYLLIFSFLQHKHGILHGALCNHDTGSSSNVTRRKRSYELVLYSPINLFVIDHHFLLRSDGLLSQLLYILCHPLNNCCHFQCRRQSQSQFQFSILPLASQHSV